MDDGQRRGEAWPYEVDGRGELGAVFFFGKKDLLSGFRKIEKWSNRQLDKRGFYELETSTWVQRYAQIQSIVSHIARKNMFYGQVNDLHRVPLRAK